MPDSPHALSQEWKNLTFMHWEVQPEKLESYIPEGLELDCLGVCGGDAVSDNCGVCDDNYDNDCVEDCSGEWGGSAIEDNCGLCDNNPDNDCLEDAILKLLLAALTNRSCS